MYPNKIHKHMCLASWLLCFLIIWIYQGFTLTAEGSLCNIDYPSIEILLIPTAIGFRLIHSRVYCMGGLLLSARGPPDNFGVHHFGVHLVGWTSLGAAQVQGWNNSTIDGAQFPSFSAGSKGIAYTNSKALLSWSPFLLRSRQCQSLLMAKFNN